MSLPSKVLSAAAVLASVLTLAACAGGEARKAQHMENARQYMAERDYEGARIELRNVLQMDDKNVEAHVLAGEVDEKLGSVNSAARHYRAALQLDEANDDARANLGRILFFAGLPERALELVEPGLERNPDSAPLLTVRAAVRAQRGEGEAARADAERAVELAPGDDDPTVMLASLMWRDGERDAAIGLLQKAVAELGSSVDLRLLLAQLLMASGRGEEAEAQLAATVELEPESLAHRLRLAQAYLTRGDVDAAEKTLRTANEAIPGSVDARMALVNLLESRRSMDAADQQIAVFRKQAPDDMPLLLAVGEFYAGKERVPQAEEAFLAVVDAAGSKPEGLTARNRLARLRLAAGRAGEAEELVKEVLAANTRDGEALALRAEIALRRGDPGSAIIDLRAALRDQPDSVPLQAALARAYLASGDKPLAEQTLRAAVEAQPKDLQARLQLAQFLVQQGRANQAAPVLEQLVEEQPNNLAALEALFRVQLASGDTATALRTAATMQALQPKAAGGYYLEGLALEASGDVGKARAALERAVAANLRAADPLVALVRLDLAERRPEQALARLDERLAQAPEEGTEVLHSLRGDVLMAMRRPKDAAASYAKASSLDPRWQVPYRGRALAELAAGNRNAAILTLREGISATGDASLLVADLGGLLETLARPDEAIAVYDAALERGDSSAVVVNNLAMLLVTHRDDEASLARAAELTSHFADSANPAFLDTYGWVLYKQGRHGEAVSVLERAVQAAPNIPVVHYHLGLAQLGAGQTAAAHASLEAALAGEGRFEGAEDARAILARIGSKNTAGSKP